MEQEDRDVRNSVMAAWSLRLVYTYDGPGRIVLPPLVASVLRSMADGGTWVGLTRRMGSERWMLAESIGKVASFAVTQQYRVPSTVVPMLSEFQAWAFGEAARIRWEVMGIGEEDAAFLAELGSPFKAESQA